MIIERSEEHYNKGGYNMYLLRTDKWYLERIVFLMAGTMTGLSIILVLVHSIYWLILTGLVSLNLLVFALTGFCPSAAAMHKLGIEPRLGRQGEKKRGQPQKTFREGDGR